MADRDPPLAGHCVALLNHGTPGCAVSTDGTLHLSLMRACSAWPAGVWIDGATAHRAGRQQLRLAALEPHVRVRAGGRGRATGATAGFTAPGQDYNHDLITCEGGGPRGAPRPGRQPGAPSTTPRSMLCALKPHGNPLASGRPGCPPRRAG